MVFIMLSKKQDDFEFRGVDGIVFRLNIYEPLTYGPEVGLFSLRLEGDQKQFVASVPDDRYTPKFLSKFITHFRFCPAWRANFVIPVEQTELVSILLPNGSSVQVDRRLQAYAQALCDQGHPVIEATLGSMSPLGVAACIRFVGTPPSDLEDVWSALGWYNLDNTVSPTISRGWAHEFNNMFLLTLDDWLANDLDLSSHRYRLDRIPVPYIPEWPKLPREALVEHERMVRKEVGRLNKLDARATFEDLVSLTSGRDSFTLKPLPELQGLLAKDPMLPFLERRVKAPAALARALRWRLRGLEPGLILRKIDAEETLNRRDEARRQQMMQDRLARSAE